MDWVKDRFKLLIFSVFAAICAWLFFYIFQDNAFYIIGGLALFGFVTNKYYK